VFLIEGVPSVIFGFVTWFYLPNFPSDSKWLSKSEKAFLTDRLPSHLQDTSHSDLSWKGVRAAGSSLELWLYSFLFFVTVTPIYTLAFFLPTIIEKIGFSDLMSNLLTVPIYISAGIVNLLIAFHSDKRQERGYHVVFRVFN